MLISKKLLISRVTVALLLFASLTAFLHIIVWTDFIVTGPRNPEAQFNLGNRYATGDSVEKDPTEAVQCFKNAAVQGHAGAQYNLGYCYATGFGVTENTAEAVKWYRKAAEQGDARAQSTLGSFYARGLGVPKDPTEAVRWYRKAAVQGDGWAIDRLKKLGYDTSLYRKKY